MSREYGMLITCDRCFKRKFLAAAGESEYDGGWTVVKKTVPIPDDWGNSVKVGEKFVDLCPKCYQKFTRICDKYLSDCDSFMMESVNDDGN